VNLFNSARLPLNKSLEVMVDRFVISVQPLLV